ncbi:DUF1272 domain-containing protein [Kordiimonas aestuarii]|uniref:DUF1272 domain-containing protein n=1 Tax=Kordiimonas aestuarii TaxID=1005925 RepID=UPI0021D3A52D|nr:DUF1272 domain-containing protein [Kordiimonas aestuarii]
MLELRPNCEHCNRDLPANSRDAMICSYECTFCADCVRHALHGVCSNCGGNFVPRPIRPQKEWRPGVCLSHQQASPNRVHRPKDIQEQQAFAERVAKVPPEAR